MKNVSFTIILAASLSTHAYTRPDHKSTMDESRLQTLIDLQSVRTIEELVSVLPIEMKANFVLKHGMLRTGENGHLVEKKVSQSADPHLPRAIVWDEANGFSVSYNGGGEKQTAGQRLDVLSFDEQKKTFHLKAVHFGLTEEQITQGVKKGKVVSDASCVSCHGPLSRPIFSMYPDWPSFYGSMNDELNDPNFKVQQIEIADYRNFKSQAGSKSGRYSPLFDPTIPRQLYGLDLWETYPFRQNVETGAKEVSRAFTFRPGLRLGIVYNRLTAQMAFQILKSHPNYKKMSGLVLHSLLQCDWNPSYPKTRDAVKAAIAKTDLKFKRADHIQLQYRDIWKIFDLKINDIDIRYSYNHEGFQNEDATNNIMHPGYINKYFNSYFDGTATIDELVVGHIVTDLAKSYPELFGDIKLRGLVAKYKHLEARFKFDKSAFENYDRLGMWFPIPYAMELFERHHRETYTTAMKQDYSNLCSKTTEYLKKQFIK